jgi:sec-independent protein translocase protein TatA
MLSTDHTLSIFLAMPGGGEWIFIILAIILLFGGKKIPELMKGIGKGMREFNDAKNNVKSELEKGIQEKETIPAEIK